MKIEARYIRDGDRISYFGTTMHVSYAHEGFVFMSISFHEDADRVPHFFTKDALVNVSLGEHELTMRMLGSLRNLVDSPVGWWYA